MTKDEIRMSVEADPARYIALMFAKLNDRDKEAFNFCVRQVRLPAAQVKSSSEYSYMKKRLTQVEEVSAQLQRDVSYWRKRSETAEILIAQYEKIIVKIKEAAEMLWVVLANVSNGDWAKQTVDWHDAAIRWRDNYFSCLREEKDLFPSDVTLPDDVCPCGSEAATATGNSLVDHVPTCSVYKDELDKQLAIQSWAEWLYNTTTRRSDVGRFTFEYLPEEGIGGLQHYREWAKSLLDKIKNETK